MMTIMMIMMTMMMMMVIKQLFCSDASECHRKP